MGKRPCTLLTAAGRFNHGQKSRFSGSSLHQHTYVTNPQIFAMTGSKSRSKPSKQGLLSPKTPEGQGPHLRGSPSINRQLLVLTIILCLETEPHWAGLMATQGFPHAATSVGRKPAAALGLDAAVDTANTHK